MPRRNRPAPGRHHLKLNTTRGEGICPSGKAIFLAKALALTTLAAARRSNSKRKPKRVVRCDWCQGWHLTGDGRRT